MPKCPACKIDSEFVYIGPIHVECISPFCRHYDNKTREAYDKAVNPDETLEFDFSDLNEEEETKDDKETYGWMFGPKGFPKD